MLMLVLNIGTYFEKGLWFLLSQMNLFKNMFALFCKLKKVSETSTL